MGRWYDSVDNKSSNIVYSRIRLARNWDEYTFPSRMTREQCGEMLERMKDGLKDLGSLDGKEYRYGQLDEMQDLEKLALRERRILNLSAVNKKEPAGLFLSEDEGSSLVLGGDDHIRMQFLASGLKLDELWHQADGNRASGVCGASPAHPVPGQEVPEHCGRHEPFRHGNPGAVWRGQR